MSGGRATGWFLNSVACFKTSLTPTDVLAITKQLEQEADRRRDVFWGDRTLDIDLLMFGQQVIDDEHLKVPHPSFLQRPFVTTPLLEIDPNVKDPRTGKLVKKSVHRQGPRAVPIVVVAGPTKLT
jgi:2-amino-4-hydroxy-6-hydroxymethyldihydropteridine diphosphokinase